MAEKVTSTENKRMVKPGDTVELVVGEQWVDDLSGISLYRGFYHLASQEEMKHDKMAKELGYVRETERQPTAIVPQDKDITRIEKACRLGILKKYDPNHPTEYKERVPLQSRRINDAETDAGSRYSSAEDDKIDTLLKMKILDFVGNLKKYKSISMLERIYDAECEGRNPTAGPRKNYIDALKTRMKEPDVGGVTKITSKVSEVLKVE